MLPLHPIGEVAGRNAGHLRTASRMGAWWRPVVMGAAVLIAYHYSLTTLARGATLQTPLAYLFLVPVISLLLVAARVGSGLPIPARELRLDFVLGRAIGVGLVGIALAIALLVPLDIGFWLYRADLLSLPVFVAGLVSLLYGVRTAWTFKFPLAFLFLAWPVPYLPLLGGGLESFTNLTIGAVGIVSGFFPAIQNTGSEGIFVLTHAGSTFPLSIGSACSGVNSLVGFMLVGGALSYVVRGKLWRRMLWLVSGFVVIWLLNIIRILAILVVGVQFGESAAVDVLHPAAGLVLFNVGVFAMLVAVKRFGLGFVPMAGQPRQRHQAHLISGFATRSRRAIPIIVVILSAASIGIVNGSYSRYDPFANGLSQPQLQAFNVHGTYIDGWSSTFLENFTHARPFFGEQSTWTRTSYGASIDAELSVNVPVYVDVVSTPDSNALAAYGLDQCYRFHGYVIESERNVTIADGLTATVIDYHNPKLDVDWSALVWEVPYQHADEIWYERVVVFLANGSEASYEGVQDVLPGGTAAAFETTDEFLTIFATELLESQLREAEQA